MLFTSICGGTNGYNEGDLVVLGIAAPGVGQEGNFDSIVAFLSENEYTFPVAMDSLGAFTSIYGIRAYPTTFMISEDGSVYGYVEGALTEDLMHSIVNKLWKPIINESWYIHERNIKTTIRPQIHSRF